MAVVSAVKRANDSRSLFSVFSHRRYSLYFGGQLVSLIGTWMQQVALSWLVFSVTKSPFWLAVVGVAGQLPSLLIMPFAGVFADRFNRHKIILATQLLMMVQAGALALLTLTHNVHVSYLFALSLFGGVLNAFDLPTRSAFVVGLVENKEDLPQAIAMNSTLMNVTRLIGPALAGFIVAAAGEGFCFLLNALSYIAVIGALLMIKGNFEPEKRERNGLISELKEGLSYTWNTLPVRALILLLGAMGMGGMAYALLLPVFVKHIGGDANTLGYLMSASATGSLVGTVMLAKRGKVVGLGRWIVIAAYLFAGSLFALSFAHNFVFAVVALFFVGASMMVLMSASSTILQSIIDENKRGRVMSFFTMAFMGTAPIGSLICGTIADRIGFNATILGCSIYCLLIAIVFSVKMPMLRAATRPLYIEKGLIEVDDPTES